MISTSAPPLSSDDADVIRRDAVVDRHNRKTPVDRIHYAYEVARTVHEIQAKNYGRVALQFPDDLLVDAASIVDSLKNLCVPVTAFYVLGDTSYGSCCVDEVAAEHVNADVIIHYGRACLSPTSKVPVIYVFGHLPLDTNAFLVACRTKLPDLSKPLLLVSDTTYISSQAALLQRLREDGYVTVIAATLKDATALPGCKSESASASNTLPGRTYALPKGVKLASVDMLFIGPPSPTLTTVLMTHASLVDRIYSYDPTTCSLSQETSQNIALRRRYAMVQKARDAGVIGIVVGTLGVSQYFELIQHLRSMITKAGKKSYLFAMGKLNPSKMANFGEIDAFVLVACGENSLIESRDFYKPVVTPFELGLALRTHAHDAVPWTGDWITDFSKILALPDSDETAREPFEDDDAPHFSLVTGKYSSSSRPMNAALETATDADSVVAKRAAGTVATVGGLYSPAAHHLSQRQNWAGLGTDHDLEEKDDEFSSVTEGRRGVARGYT